MHPVRHAALLAALLAAVPATSRAADVTPEQARTLEGQIRAWFQGMAGPDLPVAASPIQVTPEGDHFRLASPPPGVKMPVQGWPTAVANAKPLDAGRWALDGIRVQTPATFTVDMPAPPKAEGKPGAGPAKTVPTTYTINYAEQNGSGTWDPTFATPSVINSKSSGFELTADSAVAQQSTRIARSTSTTTLRPVAGDRVDASMDVSAEGYSLTAKAKPGAADAGTPGANMQASAAQVKVIGTFTGVSRDRMAQLVPALVRFAPAPGAAPVDGKAPPNPEGVRLLVEAMQGFASGMTLTEVLDDFKVSGPGFSFASKQIRFGMDAKADGGMMMAAMDFGMDGIALPGMGLEAFADLLPQRITMRPTVSQVPTKELLQLMQTAMLNPKGTTPPAEVAALFSHGGLKAGLESFSLDMGGASFEGTTSISIPSPEQASGTARITATNIDALLAKVQANPMLAQGMAAIVFAKGIGRNEGGKLVWDMQFDKGKVLVNGVDLMKMAGK